MVRWLDWKVFAMCVEHSKHKRSFSWIPFQPKWNHSVAITFHIWISKKCSRAFEWLHMQTVSNWLEWRLSAVDFVRASFKWVIWCGYCFLILRHLCQDNVSECWFGSVCSFDIHLNHRKCVHCLEMCEIFISIFNLFFHLGCLNRSGNL